MQKKLYLDHNATTPLSIAAQKAVMAGHDLFANPSSLHQAGQAAKNAIEEARQQVADFIHCAPSKLLFTGSATEANNMVIHSILQQEKKPHIISSAIEHPSITAPLKAYEDAGGLVTWIAPEENGRLNTKAFEQAITPNTALLIAMMVNNETGVIQPIEAISTLAQQHNIPLLCDAVQALGKVPLSLKDRPPAFMTLSSHKVYGPKGVGALFINDEQLLRPLLIGGGQEKKLRAGTENTPAIMGFAAAVSILSTTFNKRVETMHALKQFCIDELKKVLPQSRFNGDLHLSSCNTLNFAIPGLDGHGLAINLDLEGIAVSTGSACSTGSIDPSPTLLAMGQSSKTAKEAIRVSFGPETTKDDLLFFIQTLKNIVKRQGK